MRYVGILDAMATGLTIKEIKQVLDGHWSALDGQDGLKHLVDILLDNALWVQSQKWLTIDQDWLLK